MKIKTTIFLLFLMGFLPIGANSEPLVIITEEESSDIVMRTDVLKALQEGVPVLCHKKLALQGLFQDISDSGEKAQNYSYYESPESPYIVVAPKSSSLVTNEFKPVTSLNSAIAELRPEKRFSALFKILDAQKNKFALQLIGHGNFEPVRSSSHRICGLADSEFVSLLERLNIKNADQIESCTFSTCLLQGSHAEKVFGTKRYNFPLFIKGPSDTELAHEPIEVHPVHQNLSLIEQTLQAKIKTQPQNKYLKDMQRLVPWVKNAPHFSQEHTSALVNNDTQVERNHFSLVALSYLSDYLKNLPNVRKESLELATRGVASSSVISYRAAGQSFFSYPSVFEKKIPVILASSQAHQNVIEVPAVLLADQSAIQKTLVLREQYIPTIVSGLSQTAHHTIKKSYFIEQHTTDTLKQKLKKFLSCFFINNVSELKKFSFKKVNFIKQDENMSAITHTAQNIDITVFPTSSDKGLVEGRARVGATSYNVRYADKLKLEKIK